MELRNKTIAMIREFSAGVCKLEAIAFGDPMRYCRSN